MVSVSCEVLYRFLSLRSLTASRLESYAFKLTLACERVEAGIKTADIVFYGKGCRDLGYHENFAKECGKLQKLP